MKKIVSVVLSLVLVLAICASASAELYFSNLKVEIDAALKEYAAAYDAKNGTTTRIETVGGGADYSGSVKAALQAGNMPDIFVIEGKGGYEVWKDYILDVSDQPFAADTGVGFKVDGKTYGFPVAVEGFGLAYNADILAKAGIDPATLTTFSALKAAFETLDAKKADLGLNAVISIATSVAGGMTWVTGNQNFSAYLSAYLPYGDMSIIDKTLAGEVDKDRLTQYATFVKLLFDYADQDILLNGNYDANVNAFATGKTAFCHQGNWIDPNLKTMNVTFNMGYVGELFTDEPTQSLMVAAPSWYVVNSQGKNIAEALKFLNDMVFTPEGQDYMVNKAGMVPAFASVTLQPSGQLSQAVMKANAAGNIYSWGFGYMPDGFGMNQLGPIFELLAQNAIDVPTFVDMAAAEIAKIPAAK
jgi:raffinose/stachyose/melibiose transport system substrate-binding protein